MLVGHGYGGLVIKNLIFQTYNHVGEEDDIKQRDKEWRKAYNFLQKLRGIVFFSVPHSTVEGTREFEHYIMESSKSRVLRRSGLLKWLKNDMEAFSQQMKQLSVDFEARVPKRTVILSFVEGKSKVSKLLLGIWLFLHIKFGLSSSFSTGLHYWNCVLLPLVFFH